MFEIEKKAVNKKLNSKNKSKIFNFTIWRPSENFIVFWSDRYLQSSTEIIETNAKNGVVPLSHRQCKTLFNDHTVRLKIISLQYIFIKTEDLGLVSHVTIITRMAT